MANNFAGWLRNRRPRYWSLRDVRSPSRRSLRLESLEHRLMLHGEGEPEHELTNHVHHNLSIFVEGDLVIIPADIGVEESGVITANPHTHAADNRLHVHPLASGTPEDYATVGDFFDTWRTDAAAAGNNPDAVFSSTEILGHFVDEDHVIRMFVNGELNDEYENYEMHALDDIVIRYDSLETIETYGTSVYAGLTNPIITLNTNLGYVDIELYAHDTTNATATPITVENFFNYLQDRDYINSYFNRYVPDFVLQGGSLTTTQLVPTEFDQIDNQVPTDPPITNEPFNSNILATVAMAKSPGNPNSATSTFFFNLADNSGNLDNQNGGFTPFGRALNFGELEDILATLTRVNLTPNDPNSPYTTIPHTGDSSEIGEFFVIQSISSNVILNGTVYEDVNLNGTQDGGEDPLQGVTVYVDENDNKLLDANEISTVTDADGNYQLNAPFGDFTVRQILPTGYVQSSPAGLNGHVLSVTADNVGTDLFDLDFGNVIPEEPTGIDLLPGSDSGVSSDDNLTRFESLEFRVSGVIAGSTVTLYSGNTIIGTRTASGTSVVVNGNVAFFSDGVHNITATQTSDGVTSGRSPALTITVDRTADGFTTTAPTSAFLGENYLYNVGHQEELVGQQNLSYSLATAPTGMTIDVNTGQIIWNSQHLTLGQHSVVVNATDRAGNVGVQSFAVNVQETPEPPTLSDVADQNVDEGNEVVVTLEATDPNLPFDELHFSLVDAPPGATIDGQSGQFRWQTDELDGSETYSVTVEVEDSTGLTDQVTFSISVAEVNSPPILTAIDNRSVTEGQSLSFTAEATDPDVPAQDLIFSLVDPPEGATIDPDTGDFDWTPAADLVLQDFDITIRVTDGELSDEETFVVSVVESLAPPVLSPIADRTVDEGDAVVLTAQATDPNIEDTLRFSLAKAPAGATINTISGEFRWSTGEADGPDTYEVEVVVTDATGLTDSQTFSITVEEVNTAPQLEPIFDQQVTEGQALRLQAIVSDADLPAQDLTFSLGTGAPAGATIDPVTGEFSWTPSAGSAGQVAVTIEVADSAAVSLSDSVTFMVEVVRATSLEAFGQSLATSTRSQIQPITPPLLPIDYAMIDLPSLVNGPTFEAPNSPPPNPVSDFANVGSGGSGSSSSSGDNSSSENATTTVFKPVDGEESDGDGKRAGAGDEDEQDQGGDGQTPTGDGASAAAIDEAISQLMDEMASEGSG